MALSNAAIFSHQLNAPVIVEDTGIYFKAYNKFPGENPNGAFKSIGYEGLMRLLKGKTRKAEFRTAVAFCQPNKTPMLFVGKVEGMIGKGVRQRKMKCQPFDRIFIPQGYKKTYAELGFKEKSRISHRAMAFMKLGAYLKKINRRR